MNNIIKMREFGRKGITTTPWIGDVVILIALSIVIAIASHNIWGEAIDTSIRSASGFFCVMLLLVIVEGFSFTRVYPQDGIIKTWSVGRPYIRTFRISQISTIEIKTNDWCRNNIILNMKDGKQHKLSIKDTEEFISVISSSSEQECYG